MDDLAQVRISPFFYRGPVVGFKMDKPLANFFRGFLTVCRLGFSFSFLLSPFFFFFFFFFPYGQSFFFKVSD